MSLGLASHIRIAAFDDRVVLLDLRRGRYQLATGHRSEALLSAGTGYVNDTDAARRLLAEGILVELEAPSRPGVSLTYPARSALEAAPTGRGAVSRREVLAATVSTMIRLKFQSLEAISRVAAARGGVARQQWSAARLIAHVYAFERSRLLIPLARTCLRDALAAHQILRARGVDCRFVIGVRLDPFGAHSWVQADDLVLTGTLSPAREVRPLVIL